MLTERPIQIVLRFVCLMAGRLRFTPEVEMCGATRDICCGQKTNLRNRKNALFGIFRQQSMNSRRNSSSIPLVAVVVFVGISAPQSTKESQFESFFAMKYARCRLFFLPNIKFKPSKGLDLIHLACSRPKCRDNSLGIFDVMPAANNQNIRNRRK